jgi:DNA repair protein RadA/Sms
VSRVAAVLEKQTGLRFSDCDIYVNVAGGIRISEVGVELALACALYSARTGSAMPEGCAVSGELSLAGEARPVKQLRKRSKACRAAGFPRVVGPAQGREDGDQKADWEAVSTLKGALAAVFGFKPEHRPTEARGPLSA